MIVTLTLNPCTDRTVTVDSFYPGETHRAQTVSYTHLTLPTT